MRLRGCAYGRLVAGIMAAAGALGAAVFPCAPTALADESAAKSGVTVRKVEISEKLPYGTTTRTSWELGVGTSKTVQPGREGLRKSVVLITERDGQEVSRQVLQQKVVREPVNEIVLVGRAGSLASRGGFAGRKTLVMVATGYDPSPEHNGGNRTGRGATGLKIGHGLVAVDPKVIPLGTRLYIEGYGYAVAGDTGGAIKGMRIDLGHDTRSGAMRVGRRTVIVHILD